ncbi:MAG TPA: hypothetical protein VFT38_10110 [Vicinamibacteria bacterium]|nr:hypothetical protein [Vicinamibacteria bacterium]
MTSPVAPSPPPPGPHVRGPLFLARFEYVRREHGPGMVAAVLQALDPSDRGALRGVDRREWYPFGTLVRLDRAIARVTASGDDAIYERIGRACARHRTEWLGPDARLHSIHGFLSRLADQHPRLHSFGEAVYLRHGFREGTIAFSKYPEPEGAFCRATLGYLRGAVERLSRAPVAVEERSCQCRRDESCQFWISWAP